MVHDIIDALSLVDSLLDKTLLDGHYSVILYITCHIDKETIDNQVKYLIDQKRV